MKSLPLILLFLATFSFSTLSAQNYASLASQADSLYRAKDFKNSLLAYERAFKIEQKKPSDLYNAACSAALAGEDKKALKLLNLALDKGWTNVRHLKSDADLNSLHGKKAWNKLADKMQRKVDAIEASYDKPLQAELLQIFDDDQKDRKRIDSVAYLHGNQSAEMTALWKVIQEKDSLNLLKVRRVLDTRGWVGSDLVGGRASQALFLVIQHADLATQQKYLPMMREAVKKGSAQGSSLALLEDRVALREGRRQTYGSQIGTNSRTGDPCVLPLEDPDNVDKRRAEVGLGTLAEYVRHWGMTWNPEEYKKQLPEIERQQNH